MPRHPGYLTCRDRSLLEFVERYRAVTSTMLLLSNALGTTRSDNVARGKEDRRQTFTKAKFVEGGSIGPAKGKRKARSTRR